MPSNMARNVMDQLTKSGRGEPRQAGRPDSSRRSLRNWPRASNLKEVRGVLVSSELNQASRLTRRGFARSDVITQVNGARADAIPNPCAIASRPCLREVTSAIPVVRDGHEEQMHAKLTELKADNEAAASEGGGGKQSGGGQLGISVQPVTPEMASRLKLKTTQGVVITDDRPNSPAAEAGCQPNDVILEVNHQAVKSGDDIRAGVKARVPVRRCSS